MDERLQFILDAQSDRFTMAELCARYGVSRRIGYKWLALRRRGQAWSGGSQSCAALMSPQDSAVLTELLCEFRRSHPDWGARKLLKVLRGRHPEIEDWPAASTTSDLLARRGLVRKRRRRHPHQHPGVVPISTAAPNDLWTADFKGQFRTGNGVYCYPLTIADQHTRFLLTCHGLHFLVKKVTDAGTFRFQKRLLYLANSLVDQHIGLEETDDGVWSIYFNTILLATLDERDYIIRG